MNSRKGLKRHGMRSYIVEGPLATFIIQRDKPWRYFVRHSRFANVYADFFAIKFRRLGAARAFAEKEAGIDQIRG